MKDEIKIHLLIKTSYFLAFQANVSCFIVLANASETRRTSHSCQIQGIQSKLKAVLEPDTALVSVDR